VIQFSLIFPGDFLKMSKNDAFDIACELSCGYADVCCVIVSENNDYNIVWEEDILAEDDPNIIGRTFAGEIF
jgi:hypothetical protein